MPIDFIADSLPLLLQTSMKVSFYIFWSFLTQILTKDFAQILLKWDFICFNDAYII